MRPGGHRGLGWIVLAAVGGAALVVAGCETLIGADFGGVQVVDCSHVSPPGPPTVQDSAGTGSLTFAVYTIDLGDTTDDAGNPGYRDIGYDLDGVCTNEAQGPSCRPIPWANGDPTDGIDGRDNGIGRIAFDEAVQFGSAPVTGQSLTAGTLSGALAPMAVFRLTGYNLRVDDAQVELDWYVPQRLGAQAADGGPPPQWNGDDIWPVTAGTILADSGSIDGGTEAYPASAYRDTNAYVSNYTVVARMPSTVLQLSNVPLDVESMVVELSISVNPLRFVKGTIAGRLRLSELFHELPQLTQAFQVGLTCLGDPSYPRLKQYFCSHAEILIDGQVDPSVNCDALSFGVAFTGVPVQLGPVVPAPMPASCPASTDPSGDTCANSSSPDTVDASGDAAVVNCVAPGTPNNAKGVGGYCQSGADCVASVSICSADFGAPPGNAFCTKLCQTTADCGSGAYCAHSTQGVACVPLTCGSPDAGADGGGDAAGASDAKGGDSG